MPITSARDVENGFNPTTGSTSVAAPRISVPNAAPRQQSIEARSATSRGKRTPPRPNVDRTSPRWQADPPRSRPTPLLPYSPTPQRIRHHTIPRLGSDRAVAAGDDDDELPAVRRLVGHGRRLPAGWQPRLPELLPPGEVVGAQIVVDRSSEEDDPAGRDHRPAYAGNAQLERQRQRRHVVNRAVAVLVDHLAGPEIGAGD